MQQETQRRSTAPQARNPAAEEGLISDPLGPYIVGADDVISVAVTPAGEPPSASIPVRVAADGTIEPPMVGKIKVADMTLAQAEAAVRQAYVPRYHVQAAVHIQVVEAATTHVLVVGAVDIPGLVKLQRNQRDLLHAAVAAGGASQAASGLVTLRRLREPTSDTTLNLRDPMDLKKALTIEPLEDGDIVAVQAARPNTVFVGGLVNVAGAQTYPPGTQLTVLQALAAAGGLRMDLIPPEATLIRRLEDKDVQVKLDLDRLSKGKDRNIALAPGDILWVPHTVGTRIHDFINQTVYVRIGATAGYTAYYSDMGSKRYGDLKDRGAETVIITK